MKNYALDWVAEQAGNGFETVTWMKEMLRAVWPMYESAWGRWAIGKAQPLLDGSVPHWAHAMRRRAGTAQTAR